MEIVALQYTYTNYMDMVRIIGTIIKIIDSQLHFLYKYKLFSVAEKEKNVVIPAFESVFNMHHRRLQQETQRNPVNSHSLTTHILRSIK